MTAAKAVDKNVKNASTKVANKLATKKVVREPKNAPLAHGVGRRKASVARVWVRPNGTGLVTINNRDYTEYFTTIETRQSVQLPITIIAEAARFNFNVNVNGGGTTGQAEASQLAIARALAQASDEARLLLKEQGLLTVDSRIVERKKPGQKGARRKFQFVKR